MRLRKESAMSLQQNNIDAIKKVLAADRFELRAKILYDKSVNIIVTNTKFRSTAQAIGRVSSTLQRFTSDKIHFANISFASGDLVTATYRVDLNEITREQFNAVSEVEKISSITSVDSDVDQLKKMDQRFNWAIGPYFTHRLFNRIYH